MCEALREAAIKGGRWDDDDTFAFLMDNVVPLSLT